MSHENFIRERGESIKQQEICIGDLKLKYELYETYLADEKRYSYSISVTSDDETVCAPDVTSLRGTALQLLDTVSLGEVTPCTLYDVLENIL